ncbi:hypothetical protein L6164_017354 [Bauhinia variegata]|uniref:Uncharacterized protein n=1 Tax=Bauhinia variegata TaxID=167791 RepID=A0ACB9N8D6_BAUVA|nr:hypothetical protein L6164_017354 [Bauhinia variegata]
MRLQNHPLPKPELVLEFNGKTISTDEQNVSDAINIATDELAGNATGISNTPLTLLVKKNGVPDLTMVDLPGISREPVHGQPENIYDQIRNIIMEYIRPEESIILNVLSAAVDFATCESIRMSQTVDKTGDRTLAVVTKADKAPEGLLEKVTADDVHIGLGYVCVRNRIGDESYDEARLFETHHLLSKIDKSIVGVPVLAQKLVEIQASSISRNLPEIVKKINEKLNFTLSELEKLPNILTSDEDAMTALMQVIGLAKDSLRKILLAGEFDEYPDDKQMHCTGRLAEMLNEYSNDLIKCAERDSTKDFLKGEIKVLEEAKIIGLPNFTPRTAFLTLLKARVKGISSMPTDFIDKVWNYLETVVNAVLRHHSEPYYHLQMSSERAGQSLIAKMKENSMKHVKIVVEMQKLTDYTCSPEYMAEYNKLMTQQNPFVTQVLEKKVSLVELEGIGNIVVSPGHLSQYPLLREQAFDLKMRMTAYWKIVLRRLVDDIALHLQFSINNLVNKDLEIEIVADIMSPIGGGIERLLDEVPSVARKRTTLNQSVKVLRESKNEVAKIIDKISSYGN